MMSVCTFLLFLKVSCSFLLFIHVFLINIFLELYKISFLLYIIYLYIKVRIFKGQINTINFQILSILCIYISQFSYCSVENEYGIFENEKNTSMEFLKIKKLRVWNFWKWKGLFQIYLKTHLKFVLSLKEDNCIAWNIYVN